MAHLNDDEVTDFGPFRLSSDARQDHFEGDMYADDDKVTRGISLAGVGAWSLPEKQPAGVLLPNASVPFQLPVERMPRNQRALVGDAPTEFVQSLITFLETSCDSVVQVKEKGELEAQLCVGYNLLQLEVRLIAPDSSPSSVAALWTRISGDGVDFLGIIHSCADHIQQSGLMAREVPAGGEVPMASILPQFPVGDLASWETTPPATPSGEHSMPLLEVPPCTEEDCDDLLDMARSSDGRIRAEAAVAMVKMFDTVDGDVLGSVLAKRPEVVLALVNDAECVLAAPILAGLLARHGRLSPEYLLAPLVARLQDEKSALGVRQLARSLQQCAGELKSKPADLEQLHAASSSISHEANDLVTARCLQEAAFALHAQLAQ